MSPALAAGILLEPISGPPSLPMVFVILAIFLIPISLSFLLGPASFLKHNTLLGICFIAAGILAGYVRASGQEFSSVRSDIRLENDETLAYVVEMRTEPRSKGQWKRSESALVSRLTVQGWMPASGGIMLYLPTESDLRAGERIIIQGKPLPVQISRNPYEFDYRKYLARRNVHFQAFVQYNEYVKLANPSVTGTAARMARLRQLASEVLYRYTTEPRQYQVAKAMILGDRSALEPELLEIYKNAGALHVMAVSGLHVGIIYLLLRVLFGAMQRHRIWRMVYYLLVLTCLWAYVALTGMSPSAQRAGLMFSMILTAQVFGRKSGVFNALGAAALLMMWIDPGIIYSAGFQFSFLAVLAILLLYTPLSRIWNPPNRLTAYLWGLLCLSVSAQIGTFPLTIYYFNQFPTYFFLSNLIVVPAAALAIPLGLLLMPLSIIPIAAIAAGWLLNMVLAWVNGLLGLLDALPLTSIQMIYLRPEWTILLYLIIAALSVAIINKSKAGLSVALISLCLLGISIGLWNLQTARQQKIVFYALPKGILADFISGYRGMEYRSPACGDREQTAYFSNGMRLASGLRNTPQELGSPFYRKGDGFGLAVMGYKSVLFLQRAHPLPAGKVIVDFLVLPDGIKPDPSELADRLEIRERIILAGRNPSWAKSARDLGLPIHELRNEGALIVDIR